MELKNFCFQKLKKVGWSRCFVRLNLPARAAMTTRAKKVTIKNNFILSPSLLLFPLNPGIRYWKLNFRNEIYQDNFDWKFNKKSLSVWNADEFLKKASTFLYSNLKTTISWTAIFIDIFNFILMACKWMENKFEEVQNNLGLVLAAFDVRGSGNF